MTDAASMKKYTLVQRVVMEGFPDAHNVFLQVTNQRFCVSPHGCDTKEDAEWMQDQLCAALAKLVDDELVGYRTPATPPDFANILDAAGSRSRILSRAWQRVADRSRHMLREWSAEWTPKLLQ